MGISNFFYPKMAKIFLLIMVGMMALALLTKVTHSVAGSSHQQQTTQVAPVPQLPVNPPAPMPLPNPVGQPATVGGAAPVQAPVTAMKPIDGVTDANVEHGAVIQIWNVQEGNGDALPGYPSVYSGKWTQGMDIAVYCPQQYTGKKGTFQNYTMTSISFIIKALAEGDYTFIAAIPQSSYKVDAAISLRIDDAAVVPATSATGTGYAKLAAGYHHAEIRMYLYQKSPEGQGEYLAQWRRPRDAAAATFSRDDMYVQK